MIPEDHPRYEPLRRRELIADGATAGLVAMEGVAAHGRGETFDYLIGEVTIPSAALAEEMAAAVICTAERPVISVNGNTAALAASAIGDLQRASGAAVEVNLFHRTEKRMQLITSRLEDAGVNVLSGTAGRFIPLSHDRALCLPDGIAAADVVLVPLEDGDRCEALKKMGKTVITIDLNPLSRTSQTADVTIVDELTRALPQITEFCREGNRDRFTTLLREYDNKEILRDALITIKNVIDRALD